MVGGEGRKPVNGQIMCPDDQDGEVDGEYAEHEDEDRVDVVVEIIMTPRALCLSVIESQHNISEILGRTDSLSS